jgi:hypothetical protein
MNLFKEKKNLLEKNDIKKQKSNKKQGGTNKKENVEKLELTYNSANSTLNSNEFIKNINKIKKQQKLKLLNIEKNNLKIVNVFTLPDKIKKQYLDKFINHYLNLDFDLIRFNNIYDTKVYDIINKFDNTIVNIDIDNVQWILNVNIYEYLHTDTIELFSDSYDLCIFPLYKLNEESNIQIEKYNNTNNIYSIRTLFKVTTDCIYNYNINSVIYKTNKRLLFNENIINYKKDKIAFFYVNLLDNLNNYIILNSDNLIFDEKLYDNDNTNKSKLQCFVPGLVDNYNNYYEIYINTINNNKFIKNFNFYKYEKKVDLIKENLNKLKNKQDLTRYDYKIIYIKKPLLNNYQLHSFNNVYLLKSSFITDLFTENLENLINDYNNTNNSNLSCDLINDLLSKSENITKFDIFKNKILTNLFLYSNNIPSPNIYSIKNLAFDKKYIVKPISGICGIGINKLTQKNINNYKNKKVYVEEMLNQHDTNENFLIDYKVFIFNGIPKIAFICKRSHSYPLVLDDETGTFWIYIEENDMETISIDKHKHILNYKWIQTELNTFKKNFDEIKQICLKLYNVLQVNICRVDFYITTKGVIIGELTVRSGNLYRGWNIKVKNNTTNILNLFDMIYDKYNINFYNNLLSI